MVLFKALYFMVGCLLFIVGFIGIFVPVLPTTVFMILALWMFSKSSQRFHDWLYYHKLFGPSLQRWSQYRVIPISAKVIAITTMSVSFLYISIFVVLPVWLYLTTGLGMLTVAWYIISKPSHIPKI